MEAQLMRLQDLRLKEGMSLEQLAELSGVDHDRLVMFENNPETIRNMHLDTARQIAKALHCNVLELHPDEGWRGGIHCAESGLRDIRRTRGYTQNELSEMTGIPQPNISWFETGYRSTSGMRLDTARRLSEALRCDPTDFLKEAYSRYENKCCIWLNAKYPNGIEAQKEKLEAEGHTIIQKGRKNIRYYVKDYENSLFDLK